MTTTQPPEMTVSVSLTETAASKVREFMKAEQVPDDTAGLRVAVMPGGCSGFKYSLNIEERPMDDDIIGEEHGIRLFVDMFSAQYLEGTTVDFVETINGSGFTFTNPNATGGCGCGESFAV